MPLRFEQHRLPNGLTIIAECNDAAHTSAVGFFVKAGSRDEDKRVMGVSHFLEHMMFKGSARRSADDVNREFDEIGARYNAYTTQEMTAYYAQVLPEFLGRAVDLLGDMLRPSLRSDDFEMEKKVILEEIGMYEDRPPWRLQDSILETHFSPHALSYRVLGTETSIGSLQVDQMRSYFTDRYGSDRITVAAAGRIPFDDLVDSVHEIAGDWKRSAGDRQADSPPLTSTQQDLVDPKLSRHYLAVMCRGPSAQDERRYAAGVLADVLGDAEGSRLYWALVDPGLADEADFSHLPHDHAGSYLAFASCDPGRWAQVEMVLLQTLDAFVNDIDAAEIERAKNKIATSVTLAGENPGGRMRGLGSQWAYLGEYLPLQIELDRIMAVDVEDVRRLVKDMPFTPRTVVRLGPTFSSS